MARTVCARAQLLGHCQANSCGDLLRAKKIFVRRVFEPLALERYDPLIAGGIRSLIDGHGQMPAAEERACISRANCNGVRNAGGIKTGAAAHLAGCGVVDDQHPHRPVALGLENEAAFEFQGRTEQYGKHDPLAQKLRHRRGITVTRQDRVDGRAKTHEPATQIERLDLEGQDRVVDGGRRWRACWDFDVGIGHDALNIVPSGERCPPALIFSASGGPVPDGRHRACEHQSYRAFKHHAKRPFWAGRRFAASWKTTDCGPSITSSVTSSPRWAGRQCMNTASRFASAISRALTWWRLSKLWRRWPSLSPIETHVSVTTQSDPLTA